jgi:hypothetical protein
MEAPKGLGPADVGRRYVVSAEMEQIDRRDGDVRSWPWPNPTVAQKLLLQFKESNTQPRKWV